MLPLYLFVEHSAPLSPDCSMVGRDGAKSLNKGTNLMTSLQLRSQGDSLGTMGFHRKTSNSCVSPN